MTPKSHQFINFYKETLISTDKIFAAQQAVPQHDDSKTALNERETLWA